MPKPFDQTHNTPKPDHCCERHFHIAYEKMLNPAQLEAVTHPQGPLLVIAGAGSGKTRTLTYRVAWLVENGIPPAAILLLSFTRKASQEMLSRASALLDQRCQEVSGGTFHSFANIVLRRYATALGFDNRFSIIDRGDSEDLIGMIMKDFSKTSEIDQLPRKSTLTTLFSRAVNKSLALDEVIYEDYPHFGYQIDQINKIWKQYRQRKREHNFVDYDDLLVFLHELLVNNEDIRSRLSATYRHILVDEYQDTNLIQAKIISLLAGDEGNIMVVGDDAQSIYAFRGANHKNIISFPDRFPGTRIIKLEQNYRSLQPILDLTNSIIKPAAQKYAKCLYTERGGGRLPILVATSSENAQSKYVTRQIAKLRGQGVSLDRIAVLFRAGFHSFDLELELNRAAIPFVKVGGFRFTESAHIKDVLAHIKIFVSPQDRLSWYRILLLLEKIGPATAQRIFEAVTRQGCGPTGLLTAPLKIKRNESFERLKELISAMDAVSYSLERLGEMVLQYYLPHLTSNYDDHPRRVRDIEQLITIMARYDAADDFLADMALEPPNATIDNTMMDNSEHSDHLTLSTIHSAKGLEWHTVFVIWALDGRFPSHHAIDNPEGLEEERRLMYVATTRAEQYLYIVYPTQVYDRATQSILFEPSRFLDGISLDIMETSFFDPMNNS